MPEVTLPQGTIHYRDIGEGPPVVFVHGLLVDGTLWRKVTPLLESGARCVVPDLPLGSHRTAMNADAELSPASVAKLVGDFLAALDLEDVTLVGNDTGGAISQLVALDHGERVGRLVLTNCDCFEVFPPKEFVPMVKAARVPGALYAAVQPMRAAAARRSPLAFGWLAHDIPDEVTAGWVQPFLEDGDIRRDAATFMKAMDKATMLDAAARLPSLKIPSLVVWGQEDRFFKPELGRRLAAALPDSRLEPIAGARTFVSEDAPEALADLIREFVGGGGVPARAASPQNERVS
jgi:pimeloyl-ACP methyl ester carboxylesterase